MNLLRATLALGTALVATDVAAKEVVFSQRFENVDYVSAATGGLRTYTNPFTGLPAGTAASTLHLSGIPLGSSISRALLYWHGDAAKSATLGRPEENPVAAVKFAGQVISGQAVASTEVVGLSLSSPNGHTEEPGYAAGSYSQSFLADVTPLVTGNGAYTVSDLIPDYINVNGASLLVIYNDGNNANNVDVTLYHGNDSVSDDQNGFDAKGWNLNMGLITVPSSGAVKVEFHVSDGQDWADGVLTVNGNLANQSPNLSDIGHPEAYFEFGGSAPSDFTPDDVAFWLGSMWEVKTYDLAPSLPAPGSDTPIYVNHAFVYDEYSLVAAVLVTPAGTVRPPPLPNILPTVVCPEPLTVYIQDIRVGKEVSLTATVSDPDGEPVRVQWKINGALPAERTVTLPPGGGTDTLTYLFSITNTANVSIDVSVFDKEGHPVTCQSTVSLIEDKIAPILNPPSTTITLPSGSSTVPDLSSLLGASDNITQSPDLIITQSPAPGSPLSVGSTTVTVTVADQAGNETIQTFTIVVTTPPPPPPAGCSLYPIALHVDTLKNVVAGDTVKDIYNGCGSGNFGWLTWAGSPSEPTLVTSLTVPGNSDTYINPNNPADRCVSVGDWVQGKPGIANSSAVRQKLDILKNHDITIPVYDKTSGPGNNSLYRVVKFAMIRITDYRLPGQNRISAKFLGYVECGCPGPVEPPPGGGNGGGCSNGHHDDDDDDHGDHNDGHSGCDNDRDENRDRDCERDEDDDEGRSRYIGRDRSRSSGNKSSGRRP